MTEIAWQDGGPVFRDGKLGTGQGCCCIAPCVMPCVGLLPGSPTVTMEYTAIIGDGSTCAPQTINRTLTLTGLITSPFYGSETTLVDLGDGATAQLQAYLRCDSVEGGWYSYAAISTFGCAFEGGAWIGGQTPFKPHEAVVSGGQCRLLGATNSEPYYPGYGLTLEYSLLITYS